MVGLDVSAEDARGILEIFLGINDDNLKLGMEIAGNEKTGKSTTNDQHTLLFAGVLPGSRGVAGYGSGAALGSCSCLGLGFGDDSLFFAWVATGDFVQGFLTLFSKTDVLSASFASLTTEDNALEKGVASQTVVAVHTAGGFAGDVKTGDGATIRFHARTVFIDFHTSHTIMDDGGDDGDEEFLGSDGAAGDDILEEFLSDAGLSGRNIPSLAAWVGGIGASFGVLLLLLGSFVMLLVFLLKNLDVDAHVLGEGGAGLVLLHDATSGVMHAMPMNLLSSGFVESKTERGFTFPHFAGDVITATKFIRETTAIAVENKTTNTTEGLGGKELDLGVRLVEFDETGRMDLDPLEVESVTTGSDAHLKTITGAMLTVGSGKMHKIGAMLGQQGVGIEIGSETTGADDDRAHFLMVHASLLVLDTDNGTILLDQGVCASLADDLGAALRVLLDVLKHLDQRVSDSHTGEAFLTAMGTGHGVTTKTGEKGQIELELVDKPLHTHAGFVREDLGDVGLLGSAFHDIAKENLSGVTDLLLALGGRVSSVDTCTFQNECESNVAN